MNVCLVFCVLIVIVFIVGYRESRTIPDEKGKEKEQANDAGTEENTDVPFDASFMLKYVQILAIVSVIIGLMRLAYPDHLKV